MKVELISEDQSLLALCREIARETPSVAWNFMLREEHSGDPETDLCFWDFKPGDRVAIDVPWGTKFFVLVGGNDLTAFRAAYPYAEPGIILKPITRAVLRAVVTQRIPPALHEMQGDALRSDRDELFQCLLHANLRLQEYDAQRNNFLGRALHDFHAPLSALSGYCGLLLEEKPGFLTDQQRLIIGRMQHSVRRLSRMSKAMFQLSVGRYLPFNPVLRQRDVRECVEQAFYEVQQLADEKQLQLEVDLEPPPVLLRIDSDQIEQVMINLLENACKFSSRRGSIAVRGYSCFCERRANNVFCAPGSERRWTDVKPANAYRIDVEDSGPGVSAEQLNSIFEEYVSYAGGQDRSRGGLGLAICRMILHQHQGRIWVDNCQTGAVFSFILPFQQADDAPTLAEMGYEADRERSASTRV